MTPHYAQFGEDVTLGWVFERIGTGARRCGEFGTGENGLDCSNTAHLWLHDNWTATLAEADEGRFSALCDTIRPHAITCLPEPGRHDFLLPDPDAQDGHRMVRAVHTTVTPDNIGDVFGGDRYDLLSVAVDGDEWVLLEALPRMPRVVVVEFNQSVPWWLNVRPAATGGFFGASAAALIDLLQARDMTLVSALGCNLIAVDSDEAWMSGIVPTSPVEVMEAWERVEAPLTWLATNYAGRPRIIGGPPPWGLAVGIEQDDEALVFDAPPPWTGR